MKNITTFILFLFLTAVTFHTAVAETATPAPQKVTIGAYINDIQDIDMQSHSYQMDLYVWFRWAEASIDPSKTAEFMNAFEPADHVRTALYDEPQQMPDGSWYTIIREQGKFSVKFPLQQYPFDKQNLSVLIEDSLYTTDELVYVADEHTPISMNERVLLPGFEMGTPAIKTGEYPYPTNFGDISAPDNAPYAQTIISIPVERPKMATGIKIFLPVALIMFCTSLVFFVHASFIEGRLGVVITALLTLVALQLTTASGLPEVDYLLMTDKIYILCYLFIIGTMLQIVRKSNAVHTESYAEVSLSDKRMLCMLFLGFLIGVIFLIITA